MSSAPERWRSSSSRLLGLYSLLFIVWSALLMGGMYWRVDHYLQSLLEQSLSMRAHLFERFTGPALVEALADNQHYDVRGIDAYGLFDAAGRPLSGTLRRLPAGLPQNGQVHFLRGCLPQEAPQLAGSCSVLAMRTADGQLLVLARRGAPVLAVNHIILNALVWGVLLTVLPGLLGWHLLRQRPLRRIGAIQAQVERIAAGELGQRLPLSARRDELDMLASIVNAMLERIEQLMGEVKSSSDAIAHDLRTPLTRLRAHLYRLRQQAGDAAGAPALDQALAETDGLLDRFRALLRISELEDHQRRSNFAVFDPRSLLEELHGFCAPLAEEKGLALGLRLDRALPAVTGDRGLLFEALGNLLGNAIKFTPAGGRVELVAEEVDGATRIGVHDSGPGIPAGEREAVLRRFYRSAQGGPREGFGLGLSIVAAIAALHGFALEVRDSPLGGAAMVLHCHSSAPLYGAI
ncbi:MAG: HAMP domain-containing sensor histidine kinase [Pseudoxanthomonas sp.]